MELIKSKRSNVVVYKRDKKGQVKKIRDGVFGKVEYVPRGSLALEVYIPYKEGYRKGELHLEYEIYGDPSGNLIGKTSFTEEDLKVSLEPYLRSKIQRMPESKKGLNEIEAYLLNEINAYTHDKNIRVNRVFLTLDENVYTENTLESVLRKSQDAVREELAGLRSEVRTLKDSIKDLDSYKELRSVRRKIEEYELLIREKEALLREREQKINMILSTLRKKKGKEERNDASYLLALLDEPSTNEGVENLDELAGEYAQVVFLDDKLSGMKTHAYEIAKEYCKNLLQQGITPNKDLILTHLSKVIMLARGVVG